MNTLRTKFGLRWRGACCLAALWSAAICARGQEPTDPIEGITAPLYVGNLAPVRDEFGRTMAGTHQPGVPVQSLVEIRVTTNGIIRPPATNGAAHPYHPLVATNSIGGVGMNAAGRDSGLFCLVLPKRPSTGIMVFARVFNAPTAAQATFYADSKAVAVPASSSVSSLVFEFDPAKPLDPGDSDGDGLNNSWEQVLGTSDRATSDYDNDGMSDLNEMLAGTAPDDPTSLLAFRKIRRDAAAETSGTGGDGLRAVSVKWQSVPGKKYQLEYVLQLVPDAKTGAPNLLIPVRASGSTNYVVTAGTNEFEIEMSVNVPEEALTGAFRVKLVQE